MTIAEFFRLSRHSWLQLLAATLLGLAAAAGYSFLQPVLYSSTATGYVVAGSGETVGSASSAMALAQAKASSYVPLATSERVRQAVATELSATYPDPSFSLSARATQGSNLFEVSATASSAELAKAAADAGLKATAAEALRLDSMTASGTSTNAAVVRIVATSEARLPGAPFSPRWTVNLGIGAAAGLGMGYIVAFIRRKIDGRIRTQSDIDEAAGIAVLGILPKSDELGRRKGAASVAPASGPSAEAIRQLRTNLRFVSVDNPPRSIVVTSASLSEGKSSVAAQLSRFLAASGQPVVLVDADLRRPTQSKQFGVDGSLGLSQVLAGDVPLEEALQDGGMPHLRLLVAGRIPPNPSELVGSQRMKLIIESLSQSGIVIIDAPPVLPVTDAGLLTAAADGAILVTKVNTTQKEQIRQTVRNLASVQGRLLGAVLNMTPKRAMGVVTYGYGYAGIDTGRYDNKYTPAEGESMPRRVRHPA